MEDLIDVNRSFISQFEFVEAFATINRAVQKDPTNKKAWGKKAVTHFMMQEFKAAAESYRYTNRNDEIFILAMEYAALKPDTALLSGEVRKGRTFSQIVAHPGSLRGKNSPTPPSQ